MYLLTEYADVHTFAALQGTESYDNLKSGFEPVLKEINTLIADGSVELNGANIQLDIYLGGDYKVYYKWGNYTYTPNIIIVIYHLDIL